MTSPFIDSPAQKLCHIRAFPQRLHVIAVLHNPLRTRVRYQHFAAFEKMILDAGALLYVVELALGDREFEIVKPDNPRHLGLRSWHELWHKEKMIEAALRHLLPSDWQYVAWIDADVSFARPDICQETLHMLQHHHFVQMFEYAQDLGPNYEPLWITPSFMSEWVKFGALQGTSGESDAYYPVSIYDCKRNRRKGWTPYNPETGCKEWKICHPGLAWAASREALDFTGGIFSSSIFGSGDFIMACCLVGLANHTLPGKKPEETIFGKLVYQWQENAERYIHRDVGYVKGLVNHYWHGRKADRRYARRPEHFLVELSFDPSKDVKLDTNGLYQLNTWQDERTRQIRDTLRWYANARNEDSIDL